MRRLVLLLALLPAACRGCEDVGCRHPLSLAVAFPEASPGEPVSLLVEYDGERRFVTCPTAQDACEVSCGDAACDPGDRDVVASRTPGSLELSVGHLSEGPDGESSCRGAEAVRLEVSRGRASFAPVDLQIEYTADADYGGGPECGVADEPQMRAVSLALE